MDIPNTTRRSRRPIPPGTAICLFMAVILLTGCAELRWPWSSSEVTVDESPEPVDRIYRGTLILGEVVRSFTLCGQNDRALWVVDETEGLLPNIYLDLTGGNAGAIYVELRGVMGPAPSDQKARGYEGQIRVQTLVRADPPSESRGCRDLRPGVDFRAWGNEPFWSVEMGPRTIVFRQPDEPSMLIFPPAIPDLQKDRMVFTSTSMKDSKLRIRITLEPKPCQDSMSGAYSTWTSTVELLGKTYRGCAIQGWGA